MTYFVDNICYNATCVKQIIIYYILKTTSVIKRKQQQCFGTHVIVSAFLRNTFYRKPDILFLYGESLSGLHSMPAWIIINICTIYYFLLTL